MPDNANRPRGASGSARSSESKEARCAGPDAAEAKLEQYIQQLVAEAPQLSADQIARLALLLRGDE